METRTARGVLFAGLVAGFLPAFASGAEEIKSGKWQFTTQMQMPAMTQPQSGAAPASSGRPQEMTACIDAAHPIPTETPQANVQCRIDSQQRRGASVTWSMTCDSPQGPIRSSGTAHYAGDTMQATLTARIPGPDGRPVDSPGRISGRYLGPCQSR
jgi:hypothetical protein